MQCRSSPNVSQFDRLPSDLIGYIAGFVATAPRAAERLNNLRNMANVNRRFNATIRQNHSTLVQPHLDTIAARNREIRERMWSVTDAMGENGDYWSDLDM